MSVIVLVGVPIGHCCCHFKFARHSLPKKALVTVPKYLLALCNIVYIVWYYICQLNQHIYKYSLFNSVFVCVSVIFDIFVFYSVCVCISNVFANHFFNFQLCVSFISETRLENVGFSYSFYVHFLVSMIICIEK